MADDASRELDEALERELPNRISRAIRWLRKPQARKVRLPLGLLFLAGGMLWFLPVVGLELIPIGLILIALDVPFLQRPVARFTVWLEKKWLELRGWWRQRRSRRSRASHIGYNPYRKSAEQ